MKRGINLEPVVIAEVQKKLKLKINKCGLFLMPNLPMLRASADGITADFVAEVKCPSSEKTVETYISNVIDKYKGQVNLQMLASGIKRDYFVSSIQISKRTNNSVTCSLFMMKNSLKI